MTTHTMRPAVALAWILGLTLLFARPQIATAAVSAVNWMLTAPAGTGILVAAFAFAIARSLRRTA
ncbi:hypothetical protein [Streptomyces goshikiensis]|uniref:hypothetical protein n=1 Tax=Streptomyces goshikiensis TaxID=1942 RepID=UPI002E0EE0A4|nr:hypothetical protein OG224_06790 [Streptomyces goshikiensis]